MPKASIDEHRELQPCQHDVRPYANVADSEQIVLAESESAPMQLRPQTNLGLRARFLVCPAKPRRGRVCRLGIRHPASTTKVDITLTGAARPTGVSFRRHTPRVY